MKCVLAPDSFKGSLSAIEACHALRLGVQRVFPEAEILSIPLADGGEGTLDALLHVTQGRTFTNRVRGPQGESIEARWALLPDGKAVIELAQASGLTLTPEGKRDALLASTYGTGQLIKKALDVGAREFLVCLGGSATTDGGTGALSALGFRFFDEKSVILPPGGGALCNLNHIDLKFVEPRLQKAHFTLLCDVTNPLLGSQGAAAIYAPQKGATPAQVKQLETGLLKLADVASQVANRDVRDTPGVGAAGGTAFGLLTFCQTQIHSGIETILETIHFNEALKGADLVLTGEGSLDEQTLRGKAIAGVCRIAHAHCIPVIAFAGQVALSSKEMYTIGLESAFAITDKARSLDDCIKNASTLLTNTTEHALRSWKLA